jgi:sugar diacid utilization regulator
MGNLLTVQELLSLKPLRHARVIAGWLGRRNVVKGCAVISCGQEEFLQETMVIVDAANYKENQLMEFFTNSLKQPVAAIVFTGRNIEVSDPVKNAADGRSIPLVSAGELNGEEVTLLFGLAEQLKNGGWFYDFIEGSGLEGFYLRISQTMPLLLANLQQYLLNPVVVVNPAFEILACGGERCTPLAPVEKWVREVYIQHYYRKRSEYDENYRGAKGQITMLSGENVDYYILKLHAEGIQYGCLLVFETGEELSDIDIYHIRQTGLRCLQELIQHRNMQEMEDKYRAQFVYDLLYNNFENEEEIIQRGKFWGWDLSLPHQIFVIEHNDFKALPNKAEVMEQLLTLTAAAVRVNCRQAIVSEQMGQIVVLFADTSQDTKVRKQNTIDLVTKIRAYSKGKMPNMALSVGAGRLYPAIRDICRSYQEAKQALELGRFAGGQAEVTFFEDLGAIRLLASVGYELLDDFYKEYLDPLIEYDEKNGVNFHETLQVYFQQNGDLNQTAEKLFMHPNTLRYRLRKIEELLDTDLQHFNNRLNLYLACKIAKMRQPSL